MACAGFAGGGFKKMLKRNRKCRWCGAEFEKQRPMQVVCSPRCGIAYGAQKKAQKAQKAIAAARKLQREVLKIRRRNLETKPQLIKKAQTAFNAFIRERDKNKPCISCGIPLPNRPNGYDAGHYRSVGSAPNLRFEELNCHGQCKHCNNWLSGNHVNYRIRLIERIGLAAVEALESDNEPRPYTREELRGLEKLYKDKRKALL